MAPENKLESVINYDQVPLMVDEDEVKKVKTSKFGCGMSLFISLFLIIVLIVIQILTLRVLFLVPSFIVLIILIGIIFSRLIRK